MSLNTLLRHMTELETEGFVRVDRPNGRRTERSALVLRRYRQLLNLARGIDTARRKNKRLPQVDRTGDRSFYLTLSHQWNESVKEARAAKPVTPEPHESEQLEFNTEPVIEPTAAELVAKVFNENRSELLPPIEVEKLPERILEAAEAMVQKHPNAETWARAIRKMGESLWLTGQIPGRTGAYFNVHTGFHFLVSAGKLEQLLKGKYDPDAWRLAPVPTSAAPSLHNITDKSRQSRYRQGSPGMMTHEPSWFDRQAFVPYEHHYPPSPDRAERERILETVRQQRQQREQRRAP